MDVLKKNIRLVNRTIDELADKFKRDRENIRLVAVSKTHPADLIRQAASYGLSDFGENKAQEFRDKFNELGGENLNWHFIGHLQTNKIKYVVGKVKLIHSLDSVGLGEAIHRYAEKTDVNQPVLIQINTSGEESKSGIRPETLIPLVEQMQDFPRVRIHGLMNIARFSDDETEVRKEFALLRKMADQLEQQNYDTVEKMELSMGMSHDFPWAIAEGATIIRVGSAIFGERHYV